MLKDISIAIAAICRTIVKSTVTIEHTIDLADREVNLLERRQQIRMTEIDLELDQRQLEYRQRLEQLQ